MATEALQLEDEAKGLQLKDQLETLSLSNESKRLHLEGLKHGLRTDVARRILDIFRWANGATLILIFLLAAIDNWFVWHGVQTERLVTPEVLMTLIGATVVQVGAAAFAIASSLFPKVTRDTD